MMKDYLVVLFGVVVSIGVNAKMSTDTRAPLPSTIASTIHEYEQNRYYLPVGSDDNALENIAKQLKRDLNLNSGNKQHVYVVWDQRSSFARAKLLQQILKKHEVPSNRITIEKSRHHVDISPLYAEIRWTGPIFSDCQIDRAEYQLLSSEYRPCVTEHNRRLQGIR